MGKGKSKSFKPEGKDKSRIAKTATFKKAKKSSDSGIKHGRIESAKSERKVILGAIQGLFTEG